MLNRARTNATAGGFGNVEFRDLVPDKSAVYREVARVLRPGGRMVVSDVVLDAPLPPAIAESVAALTGCVAGASLRNEYLQTIGAAGLVDIEVVSDKNFGEMALTIVPTEFL